VIIQYNIYKSSAKTQGIRYGMADCEQILIQGSNNNINVIQ
jgi:hypothetical protein